MTSFGYRIDRKDPAHVYVTVWAGPDAEHREHSGQIVLGADEVAEFTAMIDAREAEAALPLGLQAFLAESAAEIVEAWQNGEATR